MMINAKVSCVAFIVMLLAFSQISVGQSADTQLLNTPIQNLRLKKDNVNTALSELSGCYGFPIGFEFALTDKQSSYRNIELDIPAGTLKDVLDAIVKQDARY